MLYFSFTEMKSALSLKEKRGEISYPRCWCHSPVHTGTKLVIGFGDFCFLFFKQTRTGVCFKILFTRSGQNQSGFYLKSADKVKLELLGYNFKNILTILAYPCSMSPPPPVQPHGNKMMQDRTQSRDHLCSHGCGVVHSCGLCWSPPVFMCNVPTAFTLLVQLICGLIGRCGRNKAFFICSS